jgi:hypothetical protein
MSLSIKHDSKVDLDVHSQLHSKLRLSNAGDLGELADSIFHTNLPKEKNKDTYATKFDDFSNMNPASNHGVEFSAKRDDRAPFTVLTVPEVKEGVIQTKLPRDPSSKSRSLYFK